MDDNEPLPSWNDGAARATIVGLVEQAWRALCRSKSASRCHTPTAGHDSGRDGGEVVSSRS